MLVEEAIEKLTQARDTADPDERVELIDEVIEALEEGKIEPAETYTFKLKLKRVIETMFIEDGKMKIGYRATFSNNNLNYKHSSVILSLIYENKEEIPKEIEIRILIK